jgi:hypothetical protein
MGLGGFRPKVNKEANLESLMGYRDGKEEKKEGEKKERELEEEKGHDIIENTTGC